MKGLRVIEGTVNLALAHSSCNMMGWKRTGETKD